MEERGEGIERERGGQRKGRRGKEVMEGWKDERKRLSESGCWYGRWSRYEALNTYFDGDVVFANISHLDELVDAVDGQIALHICIQVPGGGHTDGMQAHHLKI